VTPDSPYTQRWRNRQHSWRHTSEGGFDKRQFEVALISTDTPAKAFVQQHHYSGTFPSATVRAGLYQGGSLVGVAVLGTPMQSKVLTGSFPDLVPFVESMELSRFVLLDKVPANAETWFLAQAFRLAALQGVRGVVSFADPVERTRVDGTVVSPGHVGTIYQASNAVHVAERSTPRTLVMGPDGRVLSARTMQKIRRQERGSEYAARQLLEWGAPARQDGEDPALWLRRSLVAVGARNVRHPGNFRYLFRLGTKAERSRVTIGLAAAPYPKKVAA
jgi:hypothetical protein